MRQPACLDSSFTTVRTEGGLLPADILAKILAGDASVPGISAEDYHLPKGEKLNEAINRAWTRIRALWEKLGPQKDSLTDSDTGTSQTRETLLLPLFETMGYGRLLSAKIEDRTVDGKAFSISHFWNHSPIHLIGCQLDLDRKARGVRGAAQSSPHSMVQDFLNRSDAHLWGFCSNGLLLRILRDNQSLSRQAFIEFDLEAMFEGEVFSDFALLWLLCHQSRVESDDPVTCWLEVWARSAQDQGVRALDTLRGSVQKTIEILGQGFLESRNPDLKDRLRSGELSRQDYFRQLLRLVYRLLFLFAAEDRGLLHAPGTAEDVRKRYAAWHSTTRLRRLAGKLSGTKHHDLYEGLKLLMRRLGSEEGCPELGLTPLGSFLWSAEALPDLSPALLSNEHLLRAVRALAYMEAEGLRRPVDYKNVGARELGSIYESLLELHPDVDILSGSFTLQTSSGNERKTTGSYYTPTPLINSLLDSALEPVVAHAMAMDDPECAILNLKVCDPACGSGHFLIATAHRLAKRLAGVRTGDEEPGPDAIRKALRDVIGRCIYGVDINPMAVELCKVSLWLEALEPGKPLSFLDHHIRCGNSLIGATPELIAGGLPDETFKPIEGDGRAACTALKKCNAAAQKKSFMPLLAQQEKEVQAHLREAAAALEDIPSNNLKDIHAKELAFRQHESTPEFQNKLMLAHAWCAAFVIRKYFPLKPGYPGVLADEPVGITQRELNSFAMGQALKPELKQEVERLAAQYQFFHWHLAYPEVFARSGFDIMLGNPPWEHTELKEKEWFAERHPEIANARTGAERKRMIAALEKTDPELFMSFCDALRLREGGSHFLSNSGRYPFCGRGRINTYAVFGESMRSLIHDMGRVGCILPSGIATDDTTKLFFQDMVDKKSLVSLFDFENKGLFPDVDSRMKFCLLTSGRGAKPTAEQAEFVFFAHSVDDLRDLERRFSLSAKDIELLNPNTRTCPIFRTKHDAELTKAIYRRAPVLIKEARGDKPEENPWGIKFKQGLFNMTSDSHLFRTREQLEGEGWVLDGNVFRKEGKDYLPLYEAKMANQFDHRYASIIISQTAQIRQGQPEKLTEKEHDDPECFPMPRYWINRKDVDKCRCSQSCFLGFTDVTSPTNERSMLASVIPYCGVGHTMPLIFTDKSKKQNNFLYGCLNSFVLDFVGRQKLGGLHYTFFILRQLPILCHATTIDQHAYEFVLSCILELTYTAWDLEPFAKDCGFDGPPFRWDEARRFLLRCELDAAFFHLYLPSNSDGTWKKVEAETHAELKALCAAFPTPRHAVGYIMDTFPIVKRKDEAAYGEYRTRRVILEIYDDLQLAMATGKAYQTRLDPPPADASLRHEVAYPSQPSSPSSKPLAQGVPLAAEKFAAFPDEGREKVAYAAIAAMIRDFPEQTFRDLCRASWLLTNAKNCKELLPQQKHQGFMQAMQTSSFQQSFPEGQKIRFWKIEHRLGLRGITIYPATGHYSIPEGFNFRDAPDMTKLAPYLFEALQRLDQQTADPEIITTVRQNMSQQMDSSEQVA